MFPSVLANIIIEYVGEAKCAIPEGKTYWDWVLQNLIPQKIKFLLQFENPDKIDWYYFSINLNPKAVELLLQSENQDKIDWERFSSNSNSKAVEFMLQPDNQDKIDWEIFSGNPGCFQSDKVYNEKISKILNY